MLSNVLICFLYKNDFVVENIFENADVRIDPEVGLEYVTVNDESAPASIPEAYLKLHLLLVHP